MSTRTKKIYHSCYQSPRGKGRGAWAEKVFKEIMVENFQLLFGPTDEEGGKQARQDGAWEPGLAVVREESAQPAFQALSQRGPA